MSEPIRVTAADLHRPEVDEYVRLHEYLQRDIGPVGDQPWVVRIVYANWFYLAICSMVGGVVGWLLLEPLIDDNERTGMFDIKSLMVFPIVAGCIGLFLGAAEGIICRNPRRMLISGGVGLGVGFVGGLITHFPSEFLYVFMVNMALSLADDIGAMALLVLLMGRAAAWSLAAIPAGIGQGIALREKKVVINGLIGALLGGLIGGLLFDPISMLLTTADGQAIYSRGVGFGAIGFFVGLFVGLVEGWTKTAWLLMRKGPLAGKQFILFKDQTILGSSPKADIYLFKDDAIEPRHAVIRNRGGRFEIEDCNTPDGTYVNGVPIHRHVLQKGDQVVLGKTVLEFILKENQA